MKYGHRTGVKTIGLVAGGPCKVCMLKLTFFEPAAVSYLSIRGIGATVPLVAIKVKPESPCPVPYP